MRFVAATQQSAEPFSETPFDGILGLGFKDLSMGEHFNILDDLNAKGQLPMGTFAVFLTDDSNSEITFGGYKPDQIASDIVWAKVVRESYWQVGVDDVTSAVIQFCAYVLALWCLTVLLLSRLLFFCLLCLLHVLKNFRVVQNLSSCCDSGAWEMLIQCF